MRSDAEFSDLVLYQNDAIDWCFLFPRACVQLCIQKHESQFQRTSSYPHTKLPMLMHVGDACKYVLTAPFSAAEVVGLNTVDEIVVGVYTQPLLLGLETELVLHTYNSPCPSQPSS